MGMEHRGINCQRERGVLFLLRISPCSLIKVVRNVISKFLRAAGLLCQMRSLNGSRSNTASFLIIYLAGHLLEHLEGEVS